MACTPLLRDVVTSQRTRQCVSCADWNPSSDRVGCAAATTRVLPCLYEAHAVDATRWARVKPQWRTPPKDPAPPSIQLPEISAVGRRV